MDKVYIIFEINNGVKQVYAIYSDKTLAKTKMDALDDMLEKYEINSSFILESFEITNK